MEGLGGGREELEKEKQEGDMRDGREQQGGQIGEEGGPGSDSGGWVGGKEGGKEGVQGGREDSGLRDTRGERMGGAV